MPMRKGAKRKRNPKEKEEAAPPPPADAAESKPSSSSAPPADENHKPEPSRQAGKRAKKSSKPETEPEYFEDKRNLEDLWRQAFPVGTEWEHMDKVYEFNWNFANLEDAFEEGGVLYGKKVYLFGQSEPQLVSFKGKEKVTYVPAVMAIVSPFPPSDKIGVKSVQREGEEILPMKQMKMDWVPYIPLENRDSQVDRLKSQIFILACNQRRAALKHLKIDRVKKFEYCLPYFYNPLKEDKLELSTEVQIMFPAEPKPVVTEYDWTDQTIEDFIDDLIQDEELAEDQKDAFKEFVTEKVQEAKKANRQIREARKKALEEMTDETKKAFENMKFYKFYPVQTPDTPDLSRVKDPFINRYYGKAHEVL